MNLHKEISFEEEICGYLAAHGWLYEAGDAATYDRARGLFPADSIEDLVLEEGQRRRASRDFFKGLDADRLDRLILGRLDRLVG